MTLEQLKEKIENGEQINDFLIFVKDEDHFLVNQYINAICKNNNLEKYYTNSLLEDSQSALSLVFDYSNKLKILEVDTLEEILPEYKELKNSIIVCNKVSSSLKTALKDFIITFPKLQTWQIIDYIKLRLSEFSSDDIEWLCAACDNNINKVISELNKLDVVDNKQEVFNYLRYDPSSDLVAVAANSKDNSYIKVNMFKLVDLILEHDLGNLSYILNHLEDIDFSFIALVTNLLTKAKQILLTIYQNVSYTDLGISQAQQKFLFWKYKKIPEAYLRKIIHFTANLDLKIKRGELELNNYSLFNYLLANIL